MLEKMNTWQTAYEQLQEILNKCIELWWKPWWWEYLTISKGKPKTINLIEDRKNATAGQTRESRKYRTMIMWPMTAQEKVEYFVKNARIPTP